MKIELAPLSLTDRELTATADLLRLVFPGVDRFTPEYLDWLYRRNPAGRAVGCVAYDRDAPGLDDDPDGRLIGHNATIALRVRIYGDEVPAVLSLNTAVHPDYRGHGLFLKVMQFNIEEARKAGADHIAGVANANSIPGFRKLGFQEVQRLDVRLCSRLPRLVPDAKTYWERMWTPEELQWRCAHPFQQYRRREFAACTMISTTTRYPLLRAVARLEGDPVLRESVGDLVPDRSLRPKLWFGISPRFRFSPLLQWPVPRFLRPSPFHFIFLDLKDKDRQLYPDACHVEGIDFDVI